MPVTKQGKPAVWRSTGEVAQELGISPERLQGVLKSLTLRPEIRAGRRCWSPADVEALRVRLAELEARRARRGPRGA